MKAAVFRGIGDVRIEDVPEPEAGPEDVVVEVSMCGICGTDLHTYVHGRLVESGQVMGHEFSGRVISAGDAVVGVTVGDRVTATGIVPCETCPRCVEGRTNLCHTAWSTAIAFGRPGAFAQRVRIPRPTLGKTIFKLDDNVSDEAGATVEPLAVGVHAVKLAPGIKGGTALVLGLGPIGQQIVQVLRAYGARRVIGVEISPLRLSIARELGAEAVDGSPGVEQALADVLGDDAIDVVFECSGVPALATAALDVVRAGGTVVTVAVYGSPAAPNPNVIVAKELRYLGSIAYTSEDYADAIELLRTGQVRADALINRHERLDDIGAAFQVQLEKEHALRILVTPNSD